MYSMPPYPYLATDYGTQLSLFTHHMWIGGFLIVGVATHAAIFMVRDYNPTTRYNDILDVGKKKKYDFFVKVLRKTSLEKGRNG
ncbi:Photosystem I P700 chlorophyll a apoprotein A1 [Linum grandiflorum]